MRVNRYIGMTLTAACLLNSSIFAATTFTRVTTGPVVSDSNNTRSVNFVDINHDGYPDLFFGNGQLTGGFNPVNQLYMNNGDGTFTKITTDTIVNLPASTDGTAWGDVDNDGDLDVYISTWFGQRNLFFLNNGDGTFTRDTISAAVADTCWSDFSTWADYDRDGRLDLLVSVGFSTPLRKQLYHNDSGSTLTRITSAPITTDGDRSHGLAWGDYDNDGDADVFVTNISQQCALYRNDGGGTFTRITGPWSSDVGVSVRAVWGDIDNDRDLDMFVTNGNNQNDYLYRNNGDGTFTKITTGPEVTDAAQTNSGSFADIDNDGDLDLLVTVGYQVGQLNNRLYYNNGDGTFTRELTGVVVTDSGWSHGLAFGDIDRDGDLDLALARALNENQSHALYLNDGNANHWLDISCEGALSPRDGNGVRVSIKATINGTPTWQIRELTSPTGFGQNGLSAHFGLGDALLADTVLIRWPHGTTDKYFAVSGDQFITYSECVDSDGDSVGCGDNCPALYNPNQLDANHDGIGDACQSCCVGIRGNVNNLGGITVTDLTYLVSYLFNGGAAPVCPEEANVNGLGGITITDLTFLVNFLFNGGSAPPACP